MTVVLLFYFISGQVFATDAPEKSKITDRFWCQDIQCSLREKAREKERSRTDRSKKQKKKEPSKAEQKA